jgi:hypothetical protein
MMKSTVKDSTQPENQMSDSLLAALNALVAGTHGAHFEMIVWCPKSHVLSFRRQGDNGWVNVWLHGGPDGDHVIDVNGGYGWGGIEPVVLWSDGEKIDGVFVVNLPEYRIHDGRIPEWCKDRAKWFEHFPVPGLAQPENPDER